MMLEDVRTRHVRTPLRASLGPEEQQFVAVESSDVPTLTSVRSVPGPAQSSLQQHLWLVFLLFGRKATKFC